VSSRTPERQNGRTACHVGSRATRPRSWHHQVVTQPTATAPELTHACARCGKPVPLDVGLCEECNPLGLRDVSSSQVHGLAVGGFILAVVLLAVGGKFLLAGVGPFDGAITDAVPDGTGLTITLEVSNSGSSTGQTTCHLTDPSDRTGNTGAILLSPRIEPGQTISFSQRVTELGGELRPLQVECSQP
jgi:hypothetical protein